MVSIKHKNPIFKINTFSKFHRNKDNVLKRSQLTIKKRQIRKGIMFMASFIYFWLFYYQTQNVMPALARAGR